MHPIERTMKIVGKDSDNFTQSIEQFGNLILNRITADQNQSPFVLSDYDTSKFGLDLDKILQLQTSFSFEEKLILLLSIIPYVKPGFLEEVMAKALPHGGEYIVFGGIKGQQHRGILPTGETALYVLAGTDIKERLRYQKLFSSDALFATYGLLQVEGAPHGEPSMSGRLVPDPDWLERILLGKEAAPAYSVAFPARKITTAMEWEDLVLHPQTAENINDIQLWVAHHQNVLKDPIFGRRIKPGYRVLFYGKAGTGKTLTASLLGKKFGIPVYRIDLSQVVSKYIGETEKHIELVFNRAERKNWILFFDEADALFGKRTNVQSSNDKFANQEVSYLLQRIEDFQGLLILASNFKNNIDDAFLRRFHNVIHFPLPGVKERFKLWTQSTPSNMKAHADIDWKIIAEKYDITGAEIVNVMYYATLRAYARKKYVLIKEDILEGIKKELKKQDKTFTY
ncbi:ATP-binding protein [Flavobacteriaceae bacterium TP-CH-4]|uniref:ATP-binding protein n=1 Tax=Pelagihabitans pacificus TaxID=2696054 RepID=A0A967E451_9FLAO|nr:ATP-binding protein [Pelagihabitans pacificus]NHF58037.1 ATP-binding protein [Pelagihabitans pacificus]